MEEDELPDEAAVREVWEETGVRVELVGERCEDITDPVQLHRAAAKREPGTWCHHMRGQATRELCDAVPVIAGSTPTSRASP